MKKLLFIPTALLLFACGGSEETSDNETNENNEEAVDSVVVDSVVTEEAIGIEYFEDYAAFDTKTKLYEAYDAEFLEDDETWYAEGTVRVVITTLKDPDNGNVIQFAWNEEDEETLSFIETWNRTWKEDDQKEQRIETRDGLYTGMPLDEIVEWNDGVHFQFAGFGWDYSGGVFPGEDDNISKSDIGFDLDMKDDGYESHMSLVGDGMHNSGDDDVQGAPVILGTMTYSPN